MSEFTDLESWCVPTTGIKWRNIVSVKWEVGTIGSDLWLIVPVGSVFDVSIPRGLRWLLSPNDPRFLKAACLHDYALHELKWDRVSAAAAFSEALRSKGVSRMLRLVMVVAVVAKGWY